MKTKTLGLSLAVISALGLGLTGCSSSNDTPAAESETITLHGKTYKAITSPHTNKVWLDRNLGANQVCTDVNDTLCFGDYYQWGRETDGHEKQDSNTTATKASDVTSVGTDFITTTADWTDTGVDDDGTQRSFNWAKIDGASICPTGYRIPTLTEIKAETLDEGVVDNVTALSNFLKIGSAGGQDGANGNDFLSGTYGYFWTNTTDVNTTKTIYYGTGNDAGNYSENRGVGYSIRCIKD
jgi:uncharacterized protein (TIGR02145 family)